MDSMIKKHFLTTLLFIGILSTGLFAQQDAQYTQYMYNLSVINPAYAGSKETMNIGLLHRNQWTGFDGAPKTSSLFLLFSKKF